MVDSTTLSSSQQSLNSSGSSSSQWELDDVVLILVVSSFGLAYLIHKALDLGKRNNSSRNSSTSQTSNSVAVNISTESRLVRQQFGVISTTTTEEESEEHDADSDTRNESAGHHQQLSKVDSGEQQTAPAYIEEEEEEEDNNASPAAAAVSVEKHKAKQQAKAKRAEKIRNRLAEAALARVEQNRPSSFLRSSDNHPGLDAFWRWCDVETSLFRIYTITRKDGVMDETTIAPYNPSSRRGVTPISLRVTNSMKSTTIKVYWIDYKGKHIFKGKLSPNGGEWHQSTFVDHPWIFCQDDNTNEEPRIILHYIPYRSIPTTKEAPTIVDDDSESSLHQFCILDAQDDSLYSCIVKDRVLPHPASAYITTPHKAAEFALLHCIRMQYNYWSTLQKYVQKIIQHPDNIQCRQIRIANPIFTQCIWNTPARGVLLAAGFVEHEAYMELGTLAPLSNDIVDELSLLLHMIQHYEKRATATGEQQEQQQDNNNNNES